MTRFAKHASMWIADRSGISRSVERSRWRHSRLLILCYHGVSLSGEHEWNPELYTSIDTLRRRMALLERHRCAVLPLGEAVARLYLGELPERAVALTFDDGYYDFLARAYPLLQAYRYPATVYLTTGRCEHNFPIVNLLLSYVLWKHRSRTLRGAGLPGLDGGTYALATRGQRELVVARVDAEVQRVKPRKTEKDAWVRQVVERLGEDYDALLASRVLTLMNPAEVRQLADRGVDFQLHTHGHCTPEPADAFVHEVQTNRLKIEAMTGTHPIHFCYPSGVYRPSYFRLLQQEGVVTATTCDTALAAPDGDPMALPRFVDTENNSDAVFEAWITGAAAWLRPPYHQPTVGDDTSRRRLAAAAAVGTAARDYVSV